MEIEMIEPVELVETPVAKVQSALAEYSRVEAGLADLATKFKDVVYPVATTAGMKDAIAARAVLRDTRVAVKKTLDDTKKPLNELKRNLQDQADSITARITALESPIDAQIKAEEERKRLEKEAKEAAERARVTAIHQRIAQFKELSTLAGECRTSARIDELIAKATAVEITEPDFEEFIEQAQAAKDMAIDSMVLVRDMKLRDEQERERLRVEREELAAQKAAADLKAKQAADELAAQAAELKRQQDAFAAQQAEWNAKQAALQAEEEHRRAELRALFDEAQTQTRPQEEPQQEPETQAVEPQSKPEPEAVVEAPIVLSDTMKVIPIERAPAVAKQPSDSDLIEFLATTFRVEPLTIVTWLKGIDLHAATKYYTFGEAA